MTEHFPRDETLAPTIRALRARLFSLGRSTPWEELRRTIRRLLIDRNPTTEERIQLLEIYDIVATRVERQAGRDHEQVRRLGSQRALDALSFLFAEMRRQPPGATTAAALIAREREAGRLRLDAHLLDLMSVMLGRTGGGSEPPPPGVRETGAVFASPPGVSRPPASPPSPPSP